ncbi:hypothetical protein B0T22DRAFT_442446 [Podospora appendiculata]|uniref:Uncharacterized protein n=1 Tax=Podospora appendiculata TaxID=314037 RepID=A0AAE1CA85_9PEZI|nr:hypothetical protein B0T22DRAFT_442446 [Podospora appendiculata]
MKSPNAGGPGKAPDPEVKPWPNKGELEGKGKSSPACRLTPEINDDRRSLSTLTLTTTWVYRPPPSLQYYLPDHGHDHGRDLNQPEEQLLDVNPTPSVRQWRAVTLALALVLLSRRPAFKKQRDQGTEAEAVAQAIPDASPL